jgi:hypothetical protein
MGPLVPTPADDAATDLPASEERGTPRFAVAALIVALLATVVATVVMVAAHPAPEPAPVPPSTTPAPAPAADPSTPAAPPPIPVPDLTDATVADTVPALEAAGAEVEVYDAKIWERPVAPDWRVCTAGELFYGDTPSGLVQVFAVPTGDPCP